MSEYNIWRIKNAVKSAIADAREVSTLFTTIKIDELEYGVREITVKGRYESSTETGYFEIIFDKGLNPKKISITAE
jgi:folylpolyglutamate synthase/dihydropteroate synthase